MSSVRGISSLESLREASHNYHYSCCAWRDESKLLSDDKIKMCLIKLNAYGQQCSFLDVDSFPSKFNKIVQEVFGISDAEMMHWQFLKKRYRLAESVVRIRSGMGGLEYSE